ncbi:VCBS repeat-containing protein [Streptomyces sp. SCA3-4]|uniref:FG-GAP repeat domain-containing protein n=1 Tax=Streptomyces sichuanensis TaxID=2871810 RepID=UPI001CE27AFD|nr:VCBS repeat-containing protein [Streptomyces sichuanensis]MCA6093999.1 VCBS repeat-containing protein [Streptomyces sichuanensis]
MALSSGRKHGRALSRLAVAAIAAALVGTTAGTASAAPTAAAPRFPLMATKTSGELYEYQPDGRGGFGDRKLVDNEWTDITAATQTDQDQNGEADHVYVRAVEGSLIYGPTVDEQQEAVVIGGGWNIYDRIFSPGNLAGGSEPDLLARDKSGVLYLYTARADGTLGDRYRVGPGWDIYTDIAGRGDLNGDGKTDMVAKDKSGVLWFYKGTGDLNDPFASRVKVGGGWGIYNTLVSSGDMDGDGRSDMLARDRSGVLWFYKGNGNQNDPFDNRVRIGGGWGQYNNLF